MLSAPLTKAVDGAILPATKLIYIATFTGGLCCEDDDRNWDILGYHFGAYHKVLNTTNENVFRNNSEFHFPRKGCYRIACSFNVEQTQEYPVYTYIVLNGTQFFETYTNFISTKQLTHNLIVNVNAGESFVIRIRAAFGVVSTDTAMNRVTIEEISV